MKNTLVLPASAWIAALFLFPFLAAAQAPDESTGIPENPKETETPAAVGDLRYGGIVFYVNTAGTHGLVAAMTDQSEMTSWYTAFDLVSNPSNYDETGREFMDWRLPTRYELNLVFKVLHAQKLGAFAEEFYWSSSENDMPNAWRQHFKKGEQALLNKGGSSRVRAVRSF